VPSQVSLSVLFRLYRLLSSSLVFSRLLSSSLVFSRLLSSYLALSRLFSFYLPISRILPSFPVFSRLLSCFHLVLILFETTIELYLVFLLALIALPLIYPSLWPIISKHGLTG
jgi:hypothetical protein